MSNAAPQAGTYNIQNPNTHKYLAAIGTAIELTAVAYNWTIVNGPGGTFYIQDPTSTNWLNDNGVALDLVGNNSRSPNSQWTGLSTAPAAVIKNKATGNSLVVPYDSSDIKFTLNAV